MGHPAVGSTEVNFAVQKEEFQFPAKNTEDVNPLLHQFAALKATVSGHFAEVFNSPESKTHQEGLEVIDLLAYQFMCQGLFVDLGWRPEVGEVLDPLTFMRTYNIRIEYKLLLLTIFRRLEEGGYLEPIRVKPNPTWRVIKAPPPAEQIVDAIKTLQTEVIAYPACEQEVKFVNWVGPNVHPVLTGKENGLTVLFPAEGSPGAQFAAKRFYDTSMTMKYYKLLPTIEGVTNHAQFLLNNGICSMYNPVRILEIGGGTGGTTLPLMRDLTQLQVPVHYTFTDISNFFVGKTKGVISEEFPAMAVDYKILDIERPLAEQGFELGSYDIVLAADVFHATEYLDDTLVHTRQALKPGGLLVLGEVFQSSKLLEISFGYAGGWWRYGDEFRVHDSPLLQPSEWDALFKQTGYAESFAVGHYSYGALFARADDAQL